MLFDTDVLIWAQRANSNAINLLESTPERMISAQTYMELMQGVSSKAEAKLIRRYFEERNFKFLPFNQNISQRACTYIEDYALSHGLRVGDAIIAATAFEYNQVLATGNIKHFKYIPGLELKAFSAKDVH